VSLFVIPFLVFYVSWNLPFPFVTGRSFLFRILVELSFTGWLGLAALRRRYLPSLHNPLLWAVGGFLLISGLADFLGANPYRSFWGNYERMEGYLSLVHFGALFVILTCILEEKDWQVLWNLFLIAGVITALYTVFAWFGVVPPLFQDDEGSHRLRSNIGNANLLATYLLLTGGIGLLLFCAARSQSMRVIYGTSSLLQLMTIYCTGSRSAILALLSGVVLFCLLYSILGEHQTHRRLAMALLIVLTLLPIVYLSVRGSNVVQWIQADPVLTRSLNSFTQQDTLSTRRSLWAVSWKGFLDRPLLGWGQENVPIVGTKYAKDVDPGLFIPNNSKWWHDRAHSIIFDWLTNAGIAGVLSYFSLFGCAFYLVWRLNKQHALLLSESITLCVLLISYLVHNLFQFDFLMSYIMFFALLAYIGSKWSYTGLMTGKMVTKTGNNRIPFINQPLIIRSYGVLLGASVAFIAVMFMANVRPYLQARTMGTIAQLFKTGNLDLVIAHFDHALSYHTFGDTETRLMIAFLTDTIVQDARQAQAVKARIVQYALQEYEKEVKVNPSDRRVQISLTTLYNYQQALNSQQPTADAVLLR
jgi:hypothetical protein